MNSVTYRTKATGKVNLCLFVGSPRLDRLHPLVSVIQPLSITDDIEITFNTGLASDTVDCVGISGENIVMRAIRGYRDQSGYTGPAVHATITKRIPMTAGMGGGSADAAAALRILEHRLGLLGRTRLEQLAFAIGCDVPVLLDPGPGLVTGAGEFVEPLAPLEDVHYLIVPHDEQASTPAVYREFDNIGGRSENELAALRREIITTLETGGFVGGRLSVNDLQTPSTNLVPSLTERLTALRSLNPDMAMVSGSGPTTYAAFTGSNSRERADAGRTELKQLGYDSLIVGPAAESLFAIAQTVTRLTS